jgi:S1-C subfamily serine protease
VVAGSLLVASAVAGLELPGITATSTGVTAVTGAAAGEPTAGYAVSGLTDVSDLAAQVSGSVVTIEVTGSIRGREAVSGIGSGVIVGQDGTVVTNAHVVESAGVASRAGAASTVTAITADGTRHAATVVTVDSSSDLALLDIDADGLTAIELGSTEGLLVGDPVVAVGNPLGLEGGPSVSTGIVSALDRTLEDANRTLTGILQTDAAITEGSSGGALLDSQGRLVGITTAVGVSRVGVEGIGFAIPVEDVAGLLKYLER